MEEEDFLNTRLSRSSLNTFEILKCVPIEQFNDQPPIQFPKLKIEEDVDLKDQLYNDEQNGNMKNFMKFVYEILS